MNIKRLKYTLPAITFGLGILSIASIGELKRPKNTVSEDLKQAKEIVKKHNPYKYIDLIENDDCLKSWQNAAKQIQDSMRQDSLCHKAYVEGGMLLNKK